MSKKTKNRKGKLNLKKVSGGIAVPTRAEILDRLKKNPIARPVLLDVANNMVGAGAFNQRVDFE